MGAQEQGRWSVAVSNAALAVISANDAVCLAFLGRLATSETHAQAAHLLTEAARRGGFEEAAAEQVRRFGEIVGLKNDAQYGRSEMTMDKADRVVKQAKRFIDWVDEVLRSKSAA